MLLIHCADLKLFISSVQYEEIVKSQAPFMSSEIEINLNGKGRSILVNSFLSIPSAWPEESIIC